MKKFILLSSVALSLLSAPAFAADAAPAATDGKFPPAVVAVVDVQQIMRDSEAAKSVRAQLADKRTEYQKVVTADEQKLREAEKTLSDQKSKLSAQDFAAKRTEFEQKIRATQQSVQERARTLDTAFNGALEDIKKALGQVVADEAAKHGASVVIDRGQLLIVESSLDITKPVLEALNKSLPKVQVKVPDSKPAKK